MKKLEAPLTVKHEEMRRPWWITYKWDVVQEVGQEFPTYIRAGIRPISDSLNAAHEFDVCFGATRACQAVFFSEI